MPDTRARRRVFITAVWGLAVAAPVAVPAVAQEPQPRPQGPPSQITPQQREQSLLARQRARLDRRAAALGARGRLQSVPGLRALFTPDLLPGAQTRSALRDAHFDRAAQDLAALGFTPDRVSALRSQGVDVVRAALAGVGASVADQAAIAELVVVGQPVAVRDDAAPGDGYRSTLVVAVREVLKGTSSGDTILIRQASGRLPDGNRMVDPADITTIRADTTYLLYVSSQLYSLRAAEAGAAAATDRPYVVAQWAFYRVDGAQLRPHNAPGLPDLNAQQTFQQIRDVAGRMR